MLSGEIKLIMATAMSMWVLVQVYCIVIKGTVLHYDPLDNIAQYVHDGILVSFELRWLHTTK